VCLCVSYIEVVEWYEIDDEICAVEKLFCCFCLCICLCCFVVELFVAENENHSDDEWCDGADGEKYGEKLEHKWLMKCLHDGGEDKHK